MIRNRNLGGDVFGTGLKGRVTACRKRLRGRRSTHSARVLSGRVDNQLEERFPEDVGLASEFPVDRSAMQESLVRMDCGSSVPAETEGSEDRALLMATNKRLE